MSIVVVRMKPNPQPTVGNVLGLGKAFKIVTRGTGGKSLEIGINGRRPVSLLCLTESSYN